MFPLRFFILFLLAGSYFVSETNGEKKEPEGGSSAEREGTEKKTSTLGHELPDYIGTLEERKQYMVTLLTACGGQSQEYKVNEREISFHNCTYTCVRRNPKLTAEVRRIPVGMTCNRDKGKCPSHGDCPLPMC
uniref:Putative secreted protein n=1 Tax=Ixodes ricinus TaxID=34613 RepID=V5HAF6_IXORI